MRIKDLTESLENKYKLHESRSLTEKISDDMPDWLEKRLLTTKYSNTGNLVQRDLGGNAHEPRQKLRRGDYDKKNPEFGDKPEYRNLDPYDPDPSLFSKFRDRGISLDTVKVIEGPVPKSSNDPRMQSPNIPILLFDNGKVYAPGFNDDEKLGGRKTFGAYDIDKLLPQCKSFAYIDGNDPNNFSMDKQRSRANVDKSSNRSGKYFDRDNRDLFRRKNWRSGVDKSGYEQIPSIERYADELNKLKVNKLPQLLKEHEIYIKDAYQELGNYTSNINILPSDDSGDHDISSYNDYGRVNDIASLLRNYVSVYTDIVRSVGRIVNDPNRTDDRKTSDLQYIAQYELNRLDNYRDKVENETSNIFNSTIDWI